MAVTGCILADHLDRTSALVCVWMMMMDTDDIQTGRKEKSVSLNIKHNLPTFPHASSLETRGKSFQVDRVNSFQRRLAHTHGKETLD